MLKRKLKEASLTALCVLFFVVVNRGNSMNAPVHLPEKFHSPVLHDTVNRKPHAFDSSGLCHCFSSLNGFNEGEAPRISLNPAAKQFVQDYVGKNGMMLNKLKQDKAGCFSTIDQVFQKQGIPIELKYLAVIESKLKTTAVSRVGAVGMWQFMPATAKIFGLKVTPRTDERKYTHKSTVAAARYLKDLYKMLDDWLLVIAAYNSGPGPVYKAIRLSGSRNFWKLQYFLPRETRMHVKKFVATHYHYEGHGSMVTLTKAETQKHLKESEEFMTRRDNPEMPSDSTGVNTVYFNLIAIINDEENFTFITKK